jgi:hypothetical protein
LRELSATLFALGIEAACGGKTQLNAMDAGAGQCSTCATGEASQSGASGSSSIDATALPTYNPQDADSGAPGPSSGPNASTGDAAGASGNAGPPSVTTRCTVSGQCVAQCADPTKHTTLTGTVYDPAGNNPLPGVAVYVPSTLPLADLPKGAACGVCGDLFKGTVLTSAITGADGTFTMPDPPVGPAVPVVVQAGKWRAVYSASISQCQDNPSAQMLKLPRNASATMSASLPDIAVSTGGLDSLECLLTRVGVDAAEYTSGPSGPGHIHIFQGGVGGAGLPGPQSPGGSPQSYQELWNSAANLRNYDVVLLSCEGGETQAPNPVALDQYVRMYGGRVFASHFHYAWFTAPGSPFQSYGLGQFIAGSNDTGNINAVVDTSFAQGAALHDWLRQIHALGALGAPADQLPLQQSRQNVASYNNPPVTSWIEAANPPGDSRAMPGLSAYFSFDLRMGELVCGRVVYSDLHAGAASGDYGNALSTSGATTNGIVPDQCNATAKLSPQEAVLEYMLFNLVSCLVPPSAAPTPPPAH